MFIPNVLIETAILNLIYLTRHIEMSLQRIPFDVAGRALNLSSPGWRWHHPRCPGSPRSEDVQFHQDFHYVQYFHDGQDIQCGQESQVVSILQA